MEREKKDRGGVGGGWGGLLVSFTCCYISSGKIGLAH